MIKKRDIIIALLLSFVLFGAMMVINNKKNENVIINNENLSKNQDKNYKISKLDTDTQSKENKDNIILNKDKDDLSDGKVVVYISGEVKKAGVVEMSKGDRLIDAVDKCGGMTDKADANAINLAMLLKDEGHYIVPSKTGNISGEITAKNGMSVNAISGKLVNINTADKSVLMSLPNVGEKTADKIIEYRKSNGNFNNIEQLKDVGGIGEKKFEQLKDLITI